MSREAEVFGTTLFLASKQDFEEMEIEIGKAAEQKFVQPIVGKTFPMKDASLAHDCSFLFFIIYYFFQKIFLISNA